MPVITVFHGTSKSEGEKFCREGIDADKPHPKKSCNPEDDGPGIHVAPDLETAKRFADRVGDCVVAIETDSNDLVVPPFLRASYPTLTVQECLSNPLEPQAYLAKKISPDKVKIVFRRVQSSA